MSKDSHQFAVYVLNEQEVTLDRFLHSLGLGLGGFWRSMRGRREYLLLLEMGWRVWKT